MTARAEFVKVREAFLRMNEGGNDGGLPPAPPLPPQDRTNGLAVVSPDETVQMCDPHREIEDMRRQVVESSEKTATAAQTEIRPDLWRAVSKQVHEDALMADFLDSIEPKAKKRMAKALKDRDLPDQTLGTTEHEKRTRSGVAAAAAALKGGKESNPLAAAYEKAADSLHVDKRMDLLMAELIEHDTGIMCLVFWCGLCHSARSGAKSAAEVNKLMGKIPPQTKPFVTTDEAVAHLEEHFQVSFRGRDRLFRCSLCGFTARNEQLLQAHYRSKRLKRPTTKPTSGDRAELDGDESTMASLVSESEVDGLVESEIGTVADPDEEMAATDKNDVADDLNNLEDVADDDLNNLEDLKSIEDSFEEAQEGGDSDSSEILMEVPNDDDEA